MQQIEITLKHFGIKKMLLNCDKGTIDRGRNMFAIWKENGFLRSKYIKGVKDVNDILKSITMDWFTTDIFLLPPASINDDLKALWEYFDEKGRCLHHENLSQIPHKDTTSLGLIDVEPVPGYKIEMYAYDAFFDLATTGRSGIILYAIAMQRFFKNHFVDIHGHSPDILKMNSETEMEFQQPITAELEYEVLVPEEGQEPFPAPYQVTINPVDGIAPFTYSSIKNGTYTSENVFAYENPVTTNIYVRDNAGTIAEFHTNAAYWNNNILS